MASFHLYGIGRNDMDYILETFPIVRGQTGVYWKTGHYYRISS